MATANTLGAKIKRTITSVLPISKKRRGHCLDCGKCCHLPNKCPFLQVKDGKSSCSAYAIRPLNCRKYPRVPSEHITAEGCGYHFEK